MATITVKFLNGLSATNQHTEKDAAWFCICGNRLHRANGSSGPTTCAGCGKKFSVEVDEKKETVSVVEV